MNFYLEDVAVVSNYLYLLTLCFQMYANHYYGYIIMNSCYLCYGSYSYSYSYKHTYKHNCMQYRNLNYGYDYDYYSCSYSYSCHDGYLTDVHGFDYSYYYGYCYAYIVIEVNLLVSYCMYFSLNLQQLVYCLCFVWLFLRHTSMVVYCFWLLIG